MVMSVFQGYTAVDLHARRRSKVVYAQVRLFLSALQLARVNAVLGCHPIMITGMNHQVGRLLVRWRERGKFGSMHNEASKVAECGVSKRKCKYGKKEAIYLTRKGVFHLWLLKN